LFNQIKKFDLNKPSSCLAAFKSNNFLGFLVTINLIVGKIF